LTFEEGTLATWLHDLLKPHVSRLVVCDPRKNALLREGNQNDRVDARNLAELLRTHQVKAVYHGEHGTRALKELGRSYLIARSVLHVGLLTPHRFVMLGVDEQQLQSVWFQYIPDRHPVNARRLHRHCRDLRRAEPLRQLV
jgi:hypothetical protein